MLDKDDRTSCRPKGLHQPLDCGNSGSQELTVHPAFGVLLGHAVEVAVRAQEVVLHVNHDESRASDEGMWNLLWCRMNAYSQVVPDVKPEAAEGMRTMLGRWVVLLLSVQQVV